jgi:CRP-like cAMP-binding protein
VKRGVTAGDLIYSESDEGSSMFVVIEGAVDLLVKQSEREAQLIHAVRPGFVIGLVEILEPQARIFTARALEPTIVLELERSTLKKFIQEEPASGIDIVFALAKGLFNNLRIAVGLLRQNLAWTLDVTGATELAATGCKLYGC